MSLSTNPLMPLFPKEPPLGCPAFTANFVLTASARQAWSMFLRWYRMHGLGDVLLPAYIGYTDREGSGVFDPVRASGLSHRFYEVDEQLGISTNHLQALLEKGGVGVLLVVHWFGLPHVDLQEVRMLCNAFGVLLVEDCAHVMGPIVGEGSSMGSTGDAAFYSLHKIYGGDLGGALVWNAPMHKVMEISDEPRCPADVLDHVFRTNAQAVARHRRMLYREFVAGLEGIDGIRVMYPEIGEHVPQSCPIQVAGGLREKLYFALLNQGVPLTALYYRLIPEIEESVYPTGLSISRSILNYPVHQGVPIEMVSRVVEMTRKTLKSLRS
jgi:dTDP-4-amino-4,6-dideoxygalactose transaminase